MVELVEALRIMAFSKECFDTDHMAPVILASDYRLNDHDHENHYIVCSFFFDQVKACPGIVPTKDQLALP